MTAGRSAPRSTRRRRRSCSGDVAPRPAVPEAVGRAAADRRHRPATIRGTRSHRGARVHHAEHDHPHRDHPARLLSRPRVLPRLRRLPAGRRHSQDVRSPHPQPDRPFRSVRRPLLIISAVLGRFSVGRSRPRSTRTSSATDARRVGAIAGPRPIWSRRHRGAHVRNVIAADIASSGPRRRADLRLLQCGTCVFNLIPVPPLDGSPILLAPAGPNALPTGSDAQPVRPPHPDRPSSSPARPDPRSGHRCTSPAGGPLRPASSGRPRAGCRQAERSALAIWLRPRSSRIRASRSRTSATGSTSSPVSGRTPSTERGPPRRPRPRRRQGPDVGLWPRAAWTLGEAYGPVDPGGPAGARLQKGRSTGSATMPSCRRGSPLGGLLERTSTHPLPRGPEDPEAGSGPPSRRGER